MERVAGRCIAVAAALTVGGVIAAMPTMAPSLPDVQVLDSTLAANAVDSADSQITSLYDLLRQELGGNTNVILQDGGLNDVLSDGGASGLSGVDTPTLDVGDLNLHDGVADNLLGGSFDPVLLPDAPIEGIDPTVAVPTPTFDGSGASGLFGGGGGEQGASTGATVAAVAAANLIPGLPAAYQALGEGVQAAQLSLNSMLVDAQMAAADKLFGDDPAVNEVVNWIFSINNAMVAHAENSLNSLLGLSIDAGTIQNSLLGDFDVDGVGQAAWAAALGLSPDDFADLVHAATLGNFLILLGDVDWSSVFSGLF